LEEVDFESEGCEPFRREILRIEDEDGAMIAEEISLDDFFTGYGEAVIAKAEGED